MSAHLCNTASSQGGAINVLAFWIGPAEETDQKQVTAHLGPETGQEVEPCVKGTVPSVFTNELSDSHLFWLDNKDVRVNKASSAPVLA